MTMLEDRVRRALRETAEEITPLDVPPLRLPDGRGVVRRDGAGWRAVRRTRSWPGWLTPLAAAAAVAAVLAASLALTGTLPGHRPAHRGQPARPLPGVPRYYVVLARTPHGAWPQQAVVRATATSQTVATLAVPRAVQRVHDGGRRGRRGPLCAGRAADRGQARGERQDRRAGRPDPLLPVLDQLIRPGLVAAPAACPGGAGRPVSVRPRAHPGWPQARGGPRDPQARAQPGDRGGHAGHGGPARLDLAGRPADRGEHRRHRFGGVLGGGRPHPGLPAIGRRPDAGPAAGHRRRTAAAWRPAGSRCASTGMVPRGGCSAMAGRSPTS